MVPVLEAVPNFSEGRDLDVVRELVRTVENEGAEVLDWSADPDHHRSVITFVGDPRTVEDAAVAAARVALRTIDLRTHTGVHPRIGGLDVLPLVPLQGLEMSDAVRSARRVGERLATGLGIPVYFYREASQPPGRGLATLRRGGFERLREGFPTDRTPDLLPEGWSHPGVHPRAGATCVGARPLLLAWNVHVEELDLEAARELASELRERDGGFPGLRALGLALPGRGVVQISMNLEDLERTSPFEVYAAIEERVRAEGGRVRETEVVGMIPDALVLPAAGDRLQLVDSRTSRLLSARLAAHLGARAEREAGALVEAVRDVRTEVPDEVRRAADRLAEVLTGIGSAGPER